MLPPSHRSATARARQHDAVMQQHSGTAQDGGSDFEVQDARAGAGSAVERAILGYKAQCEPVVHKLDVLISGARQVMHAPPSHRGCAEHIAWLPWLNVVPVLCPGP